jgi:hypothetical protein
VSEEKKKFNSKIRGVTVLLQCKDGKGWNKYIVSDEFVFRANKLCILASSVRFFVVTGSTWRWLDGTFWSKENGGHTCWSFLLAQDEKRCGEIGCSLHDMSKGKVTVKSTWFVFASTRS